jgi:hypothetical protein
MRTTILLLALLCTRFAATAQRPLTKKDLAGTWQLAVVEAEGRFYYDAVKDSVSISPEFAEAFGGAAGDTLSAAESRRLVQFQLAAFKDVSVTFLANGTYVARKAGETDTGTYTFNEATQVVTRTSGKTGAQKTLVAEQGQLRTDARNQGVTVLFRKK